MFFLRIITISIILFFVEVSELSAWGFWAHQRINRIAVFALPPEMFGFYKSNIEYLTEHAVDPDKRRYAVEGEAARHYIDLDRYGEDPVNNIPFKWSEAVEKYSEDTLLEHGIVPWAVQSMYYRLTDAFVKRDAAKILKYSADIGHYIGDAHVPLHCTQNYNGQLTNQHGIHGFWESRIPEIFGDEFDFITGRCGYIESAEIYIWKIISESYSAHDSVLRFERDLNEKFPADKKYAVEFRNNIPAKMYSYAYTAEYNRMLDGMVERRFRSSVNAVASFWYSAWINAGSPDLDLLLNKGIIIHQSPEDTIRVKKPNFAGKGHTD